MAQPVAYADAADEESKEMIPQADAHAATTNRNWSRTRAAAAVAAFGALAGTAAWASSGHAPDGRRKAEPSSSVGLRDRSQWVMGDPNWWNTMCPGVIPFDGFSKDPLEMVNTYYTTPFHQAGAAYAVKDGEASDGRTEGVADTIKVSLSGRSYLAEPKTCKGNDHSEDDDPGIYDVTYVKMKLLGKKLKYTTKMNRVGCGWDASFALTEMAHNTDPTKCKDYYCDAMGSCGAKCAEIALQEANNRAWFTSLHTATDGQGHGVGYGGDWGEKPRRDWDGKSYGPKSECIDTRKAFQVAVSFPVGADGVLKSMDVELSQNGCSVSASITDYPSAGGGDSMAEISKALARGMTPVFSVWASNQMLWLDGQGEDGKGPCSMEDETPEDSKLADQDFAEWSGFSVEDLSDAAAEDPADPAKETPKTAPAKASTGATKGPDSRKSKSAGR